MSTKEIRYWLCRLYVGAETLQDGTVTSSIKWLMGELGASYAQAHYLVKQARQTPAVFNHLGVTK